MRVSWGKERMRPSPATRASWVRVRPEKKRACSSTPRALTALCSDQLAESGKLVFLHEHRVLGTRIAPRAHVFAVVAEALLDDRDDVDVDLRMPRHVRLVEVEQIRADDMHALRTVAGAERDYRHRQRRGEVLADFRGGHLA